MSHHHHEVQIFRFTDPQVCLEYFVSKKAASTASTGVSCKFVEIFKKTYFVEHLQKGAFVDFLSSVSGSDVNQVEM